MESEQSAPSPDNALWSDGPLLNPTTGAQIRVGVMGSAADGMPSGVQAKCQALGRAIAERGCCLLTGACPGQPREAALGAQAAGGHVVGISPRANLREHAETFGHAW